jgi:ubiquinone/menaquinone biosynthesis C-methylase UbiE
MNAAVLDAGCGIGEAARLMKTQRPDLRFVLLNVSAAQLELCPPEFDKIECDFHNIPLHDKTFGAVMFNYSLGHGEPGLAIAEAARLLRQDGVLFIYDITGWDSTRLIESLGYTAHRVADIWKAALSAGFKMDLLRYPRNTDVSGFLSIIGADEYAKVFKGISPVVYRFVKC